MGGGGKVIKTLRKLHTKSTMAENMKAESINILRLINTFFLYDRHFTRLSVFCHSRKFLIPFAPKITLG